MSRRPLPSNYFAYIGLMLFAGILFCLYAFVFDPLSVAFDLRQVDISRFSTPEQPTADTTAHSDSVVVEEVPDPVDSRPSSYHWPLDTTGGQRILLMGDSMNEYLRIRLYDYCHKNGYDMHCVIWYGASTKQFGGCDTIAHFIRKYKPTYVLLNFGANELFVKDIRTKRQGFVEHIVSQLGNLPFVWIGPPNWKDDTGINDLIVDNVGRGRYFESRRLTLARYSDGAHPTRAAASDWTDSLALYLSSQAKVPLRMDFPDTALRHVPHTTIIAMER